MSQLLNNTTGLQEVLELLQTKVTGGITPSGTITMTENGTYDVKSYASAVVNVADSGGNSDIEDALLNKTISTYINNRVTSIGNYAFYDCTSLTSVSFPVCSKIGSSAFYYCYSLTSVSFPVCSYMGSSAFCYCYSLTSANFPVCSYIGRSAFQYCYRLSSLTLGLSAVCTLNNSNVFNYTPYKGYSNHYSGTPYIYVPLSLVDAYKSATNWTYFSSYFSAINDN